jgi:hypothetical protein
MSSVPALLRMLARNTTITAIATMAITIRSWPCSPPITYSSTIGSRRAGRRPHSRGVTVGGMRRTPAGPDDVDAAARRSKTRLIIIAIIAITALPLVYATCVWVIGSRMD